MQDRASLERELSDLGIAGPSYETPQMQGKAVKGGGATPGVGEGIDLIFIMKPIPGEQKPDQYTLDVTKYVKTVLSEQRYIEIWNLDDIFDHLAGIIWKSRGREKVRRIRIVAHGQENLGGVMMRLRTTTTKPTVGQPPELKSRREFVLPSELVTTYVNEPNQQVVRASMTKDALVEFWGCNIGNVPVAGEAWSRIFNSTFKATSKTFRAGKYEWMRLARKTERGELAKVGQKWFRVVPTRNTKEIDVLGNGSRRKFTTWLLRIYVELVANGDILPRQGRDNQVKYMRDLFDRSGGDIKYIEICDKTSGNCDKPGGKSVRPGNPSEWKKLWKEFNFRI
jgi:hypothetical protein